MPYRFTRWMAGWSVPSAAAMTNTANPKARPRSRCSGKQPQRPSRAGSECSASRGVRQSRLTAAKPSMAANTPSFTSNRRPCSVEVSACSDPTRTQELKRPVTIKVATQTTPRRRKPPHDDRRRIAPKRILLPTRGRQGTVPAGPRYRPRRRPRDNAAHRRSGAAAPRRRRCRPHDRSRRASRAALRRPRARPSGQPPVRQDKGDAERQRDRASHTRHDSEIRARENEPGPCPPRQPHERKPAHRHDLEDGPCQTGEKRDCKGEPGDAQVQGQERYRRRKATRGRGPDEHEKHQRAEGQRRGGKMRRANDDQRSVHL